MRILITRHGETEENRAGIIQGHLDTQLSELGKKQARKLTERLRNEKIDLIVSSDLTRAADTAREVARFHDCEVRFDKRLRERFLGKLQGKTKEELGFDKNTGIADIVDSSDAETYDEIFNRAGDFLNYILSLDFENVLLVGHNGICKNILRQIKKCEHKDVPVLRNTSLTIFEIDKDKNFNEILINCVRHWDED